MVCVLCESDGDLGTGLSVVGLIANDRNAHHAALALAPDALCRGAGLIVTTVRSWRSRGLSLH
jgi:hypothetical protein